MVILRNANGTNGTNGKAMLSHLFEDLQCNEIREFGQISIG
jgi:hypothetical protein